MKRILSFLMILVALSVSVHGQITHTNKGNVDQQAEKILHAAAQKMNASAVSFSVTVSNRDANKKQTSTMKAQVLFNKGKYRVDAGDNVLFCDGTNVWHLNKEVKEVTVNKISSADDDLLNPALLLSNYNKNYRAKFIRLNEDGSAVIDLTPKQRRSYYRIRLVINTSNNIIKSMTLNNYDSTSSEYSVTNFKSGVAAKDTDFVYPKAQYPGVEVVDMR